MQNKLYVGNLNYKATEEDLNKLFSEFGNVREVKVPQDPETGQMRGFAFVTFEDEESAKKSLDLNEKDFMGRPLKVNVAIERQGRSRGGNTGRSNQGQRAESNSRWD
jgi:RNA recognition motif-containing protein